MTLGMLEAAPAITGLDAWLPNAPFRDTIEVLSLASPEKLMRAFLQVTPREMPLAMALGALRYLPAHLKGGEAFRRTQIELDRPFMNALTSGSRAIVLEASAEGMVLGNIGKYHQLFDQEPVAIATSRDFLSFHQPDHEKLTMAFKVIPIGGGGGTRLVFEHRAQPTDAVAHRRFARYWVVIRPTGAFVTRQLLYAVARRAERGVEASTSGSGSSRRRPQSTDR